jgi:hypothetical protein
MSFYLPVFNLTVNDQFLSEDAGVGVTPYIGNFSLGTRINQNLGFLTLPTIFGISQYLLVPALSEVGTLVTNPDDPDAIEVPAGSGLFYLAVDGGYVGRGFANEHLSISCIPLTAALKAFLADPISGLGLSVGSYPDFPSFLGG